MTPSEGLLLFVTVVALDVLALLADWCLEQQGLPSITSVVRAGSVWGCAFGVLAVLLQFSAGLGLARHFAGT